MVTRIIFLVIACLIIHGKSGAQVELLHFSGIYVDGKVSLSWSVARELNNDFFSVEKSTDGIHYELVGTIDGTDSSNQVINYTLEDDRPLNRVTYYRLKQTCIYGQTQIFEPVTVDCNTYEELTVYPNPAQSNVSFHFNYDESEKYYLAIFSRFGKQVYVSDNLQSGALVLENLGLENGLYMVLLSTENGIVSSQRLIVANN